MNIVFKVFVLSLAIVGLMQMKWNGKTIESQTHDYIQKSEIGIQLENVVQGAMALGKDAFKKASDWIQGGGKNSHIRK